MTGSANQIQNNSDIRCSNAEIYCWKALLWLLTISIPLSAIVRPRSFSANFLDSIVARSENKWDIDRIVPAILTFLLFMFCIFIIIALFSKMKKRFKQQSISLIFFSLGISLAPLIPTILEGDTIPPATLTCFFLFFATFLLNPPESTWFIRNVRITFLTVFVYGSLLSLLIAPSWAMETNYDTSVAILNFRLFGTSNHPNALAPFALLTLILAYFPKAKLKGEGLHRLSAIIVVILSQSKTTWIIGLLFISIIVFNRWREIRAGIKKVLLGMSFFMFSSFSIFLLINTFYHQISVTFNDPEVLTLTGRLFIWFFAWQYWLENPLFGHGYSAWSSDKVINNLSILNWAAPHAHNQFLQTLTEGGFFAEIILIGFFITLIYQVKRYSSLGKRIIVFVLALFLFRSFTEVIIDYRIGSSLLLMWVVLSTIISWRNDIYNNL